MSKVLIDRELLRNALSGGVKGEHARSELRGMLSRAQPAEVEGVEVVAFQIRRTTWGTTSNLYTEELPFVPGEGVTQYSEPTALIRLSDHLAALSAVTAERDGANERAQMILDAKNHWADRARAAERECEQLRAEVEGLRLLAAECDEYLRTDRETSIGSGSILHRKLTEAAMAAKEA